MSDKASIHKKITFSDLSISYWKTAVGISDAPLPASDVLVFFDKHNNPHEEAKQKKTFKKDFDDPDGGLFV